MKLRKVNDPSHIREFVTAHALAILEAQKRHKDKHWEIVPTEKKEDEQTNKPRRKRNTGSNKKT
jgi:hypothetical protein